MEQSIQQTDCPNCNAHLVDGKCIMCGDQNSTKGRIINMPVQSDGVIYKAPDMTIEEVKALYFDDNALIETPYKLYRIDGNSNRYYYTLDPSITPDLFTSVTSMFQMTVVKGFGLMEYYKNHTKAEIESNLEESSSYGTLAHIFCTNFLIEKKFVIAELKQRIEDYLAENDLSYKYDIKQWVKFLKKDVFAFIQWVKDYDVKPLAIEIPLKSDKNKTGGMLDIVCEMNDRLPGKTDLEKYAALVKSYEKKKDKAVKKKRDTLLKKITIKRINALVDIKSKIGSFKENGSRGDFYEENELQLLEYRALLKENFPALKIHRLYNWSPKNWKGKPSYNLKDQTDSKCKKQLPLYHKLHRIKIDEIRPSVTIYDDIIEYGQSPADCVRTVDLKQFVQEKHSGLVRGIA